MIDFVCSSICLRFLVVLMLGLVVLLCMIMLMCELVRLMWDFGIILFCLIRLFSV